MIRQTTEIVIVCNSVFLFVGSFEFLVSGGENVEEIVLLTNAVIMLLGYILYYSICHTITLR